MWIARDKSGHLCLYLTDEKPSRSEEPFIFEWCGRNRYDEISDDLFSNLKWEDEPIEIDLVERRSSIKTIQDYTIYCTEKQARKALELGAPIDHSSDKFDGDCMENIELLSNGIYAIVPTAEQMIGWIEEQGILCDVFPTGDYGSDGFGMRIMIKAKRLNRFESDAVNYSTRKEATLAAIDAALDYLKKTEE